MPTLPCPADLIDQVPDPEIVQNLIAESVRQTVILRDLLKVSFRKAKRPATSATGTKPTEARHGR